MFQRRFGSPERVLRWRVPCERQAANDIRSNILESPGYFVADIKLAMTLRPLAVVIVVSLASCGAETTEYTLYRTGIDVPTKTHDETLRIHVATFDAAHLGADQNAKYNLANCEFAQDLFTSSQPHYRGSIFGGIKIKYWCEKGRFKK